MQMRDFGEVKLRSTLTSCCAQTVRRIYTNIGIEMAKDLLYETQPSASPKFDDSDASFIATLRAYGAPKERFGGWRSLSLWTRKDDVDGLVDVWRRWMIVVRTSGDVVVDPGASRVDPAAATARGSRLLKMGVDEPIEKWRTGSGAFGGC